MRRQFLATAIGCLCVTRPVGAAQGLCNSLRTFVESVRPNQTRRVEFGPQSALGRQAARATASSPCCGSMPPGPRTPPKPNAAAIQEAMDYVNRNPERHGTSGLRVRLAVDLPLTASPIELCAGEESEKSGGEGGIRTHVPVLPDHPISSRRRYDRFGTSPSLPKIPG